METSLFVDENTQFPDEAVAEIKQGEPPLPSSFPVEPKQEEPWDSDFVKAEQPSEPLPTEQKEVEKSSDESTYSNKTFTCSTCMKTYSSSYGLKRHRKKLSHEEQKPEPKKGPSPSKVQTVTKISPLATVHFYADANNSIFMSIE